MTRLVVPGAGLVMIAAALTVGCSPVAQVDPIDARAYLQSAAPAPEDRPDAVTLQPIGLRAGDGRTLMLDVVLQGPPAPTEKAAMFVRSGIYFEPQRWLDVIEPEGGRLTLVAAPDAAAAWGNGMGLDPEYRLQSGSESVRLLLACRFGTRAPLRGGRYRVRLEEKAVAEELQPMIDAPLLIADGWFVFRLVRGELRTDGPDPRQEETQRGLSGMTGR